eukprot:10356_1
MATTSLLLIISVVESVNYILQTELLNVHDSNALCEFSYDTTLCSIHNTTQNNEAQTVCSNHSSTVNCWIGGSDDLIQDEWYWFDGSQWDFGNTFFQFPWGSGEPSGTNKSTTENYVRLHSGGNYDWYDTGRSSEWASLCNYPISKKIIWDNIGYQRATTLNTFIGIVDILDDVYVEFDVIVHAWPTNQFGNIIHIGNNDNEHFPGIWIERDTQNFYISFSTVKTLNSQVVSGTINLNQLYHIEIFQQQDHLSVSLNNNNLIDSTSESHQIIYDRNIYVSDPWNALDATISNLKITTCNSHIPKFNYLCDYANRFTEMKGIWNIDDINCIITQTDDTLSGAVTWLGDIDTSSLNWTNYKVELILNLQTGGHAGIILRAQSVSVTNNRGFYYHFAMHKDAQAIRMSMYNDSWNSLYTHDTNVSLNTDYILRVDVIDDTMNVYLNNAYVHTLTHTAYSKGSIGLRTYKSHVIFKSLKIAFLSDNYLYTTNPTITPSIFPTNSPSISTNFPSSLPSIPPSNLPSIAPSKTPSNLPSITPSKTPSNAPSNAPSNQPSNFPSQAPSIAPSFSPIMSPTVNPTSVTIQPSNAPSLSPSLIPTVQPSKSPTLKPILIIEQKPTTFIATQFESMYPTAENNGENNREQDDEMDAFSFMG